MSSPCSSVSYSPIRLQFKSPEVKNHLNAPEAVLCSPSNTYVIRQQQTSNGVHVLLPTAAGPNGNQNIGVTAISQCTSSLELMQAPAGSATPNIKALLPLFDEPEDADKPYNLYHDKGYVFENTPMSDVECHQVWNHLVAFEMPPSLHLPRRCFRPSSNALSKAWLRLLDISRAEGINLAGTLRTGTMLEALWNPDEDWPHELRAAILTRLSLKSAAMSAKEHAESVLRDGSTLDRAATVQWVGLLILQSRTETEPDTPRLPKSIFLETWKDSLPEDWREDANLDALPVSLSCHKFLLPLTFV